MFSAFDHLLINVPNIATANAEYSVLLGQPITANMVRLGNVDIRLQEVSQTTQPRLAALALQDKDLAPNEPREFRYCTLIPGTVLITMIRPATPVSMQWTIWFCRLPMPRPALTCFAISLDCASPWIRKCLNGVVACYFFAWEK
jgi:hypothetical protein